MELLRARALLFASAPGSGVLVPYAPPAGRGIVGQNETIDGMDEYQVVQS